MLSASAQVTDTVSTTTTVHKYYFYPSSNVYYDEATGSYWFWDKSSSQWVTAQTLPSAVPLIKTPQYSLNYNGIEPWKNNAVDLKKYKVKKNGKVKMKPKD